MLLIKNISVDIEKQKSILSYETVNDQFVFGPYYCIYTMKEYSNTKFRLRCNHSYGSNGHIYLNNIRDFAVKNYKQGLLDLSGKKITYYLNNKGR